jgi:hypothetical protein
MGTDSSTDYQLELHYRRFGMGFERMGFVAELRLKDFIQLLQKKTVLATSQYALDGSIKT